MRGGRGQVTGLSGMANIIVLCLKHFKVKIELDLKSEVKRRFKNVLSFLYD